MIEPCSKHNMDDWLKLREDLYKDSSKKELQSEIDMFLSKPDIYVQFLYRDENGKAVAFVEGAIRNDYVNGTKTSPVAFLEGIYVSPSFRLNGIAKSLINEIAKWALENNIRELASDALLNNINSHEMHKALGFKETERVVFFKKVLG